MAGSLFSNAVINFTINAQNALQELTGFQQKFSSGISQMRGLLAGFVGFQGLRGAYNQLTQLVNIADKWHMPVEQVSKFTNLFAEFGGTMDDAVASLDKFQNMANQLKFHSSGPLRELSAVLRTNLANKDYMGIIKALRSQWQHLTPDAQAEVQNMLGLNDVAMRRMLSASDAEFAEAIKNAEKFGQLNAENAQTLKDLEKALSETKQALVYFAMPFLDMLKPIVEIVRDIAMWFGQLNPGLQKFIAYMLVAGPILGKIVPIVLSLKTAVMGLGAAFKLFGVALAMDTFPAFYNAIKDVINGSRDLDKILSDMAKRSYVINVTLQIANKLGEWLGNFISKTTSRGADFTEIQKLMRGGADVNMGRVGVWLQNNTDAENYSAVKAKYDARMQAARDSYMGRDVTKNDTKNDNRVYNLTFNGIENPNDFINAFQSVATQGLTPIMGAQG